MAAFNCPRWTTVWDHCPKLCSGWDMQKSSAQQCEGTKMGCIKSLRSARQHGLWQPACHKRHDKWGPTYDPSLHKLPLLQTCMFCPWIFENTLDGPNGAHHIFVDCKIRQTPRGHSPNQSHFTRCVRTGVRYSHAHSNFSKNVMRVRQRLIYMYN